MRLKITGHDTWNSNQSGCTVFLRPDNGDLSAQIHESGPCKLFLFPGIYYASKELNLDGQSLAVLNAFPVSDDQFHEYSESIFKALFFDLYEFVSGDSGFFGVAARQFFGWHKKLKNKAIIRFSGDMDINQDFVVAMGRDSELHDVVLSLPGQVLSGHTGIVSRNETETITGMGVISEEELPIRKVPFFLGDKDSAKKKGEVSEGGGGKRLTRREVAERRESGGLLVADGDGRKPNGNGSIKDKLPTDLAENEWWLKILLELRNYLFFSKHKTLADFRFRLINVIRYLQSSAAEGMGRMLHLRMIELLGVMLGVKVHESELALSAEGFLNAHVWQLQAFIQQSDDVIYQAIGDFLAEVIVSYGPGRRFYRLCVGLEELRANIPDSGIPNLGKIEQFLKGNKEDKEMVSGNSGASGVGGRSGLGRELSQRERASLLLQLLRRHITFIRNRQVELSDEAEGLINVVAGPMLDEWMDELFMQLSIPLSGVRVPDWLNEREEWVRQRDWYTYLRAVLVYYLTHGGTLKNFVEKLRHIFGVESWAWLSEKLEEVGCRLADSKPEAAESQLNDPDGPIVMPTLECHEGTVTVAEG